MIPRRHGAKPATRAADSQCMESQRRPEVLDADGTYYRNWLDDLLSLERLAMGGCDERDWQATREACKIVLVSKN